MGKKYLHPPIVEAACEFRLHQETLWDLTIPGLLYEKFKEGFTRKQQYHIQEVQLHQTPQGLKQEVIDKDIVRFIGDNKENVFIQVGPQILSIHCLQPYITWTAFKPIIYRAWSHLAEVFSSPISFQRIGLRYINRIFIPDKTVDLPSYFEFRPYLGKDLPQELAGFTVVSFIPFQKRRDLCRLRIINEASNQSESPTFILDLDYFIGTQEGFPYDQAKDWIDTAHANIETVFEGCITDRLRSIFGEA